MSSPTKPEQIRIRVSDDDMKTIESLNPAGVLSITDIASLLLHAALEAVRENDGQMAFPPAFEVVMKERARSLSLNEPIPKNPRK